MVWCYEVVTGEVRSAVWPDDVGYGDAGSGKAGQGQRSGMVVQGLDRQGYFLT